MAKDHILTNRNRKIKTALFISGQIREHEYTRRIVDMYKREMPWARIIGATWDTCEVPEDLGIPVHVYPEPEMHYKPYEANEHVYYNYRQYKKKIDTMSRSPGKKPDPGHRDTHQTKQILIHNMLLQEYEDEFDVVIRVRWDSLVGRGLSLYRLVEEAMMDPAVVTMSCRSTFNVSINHRMLSWDSKYCAGVSSIPHVKPLTCAGLFPFEKEVGRVIAHAENSPMIIDYGLIVHRTYDWDTELVDRLHRDELLLPAEWGWYQVLVEHPQNRHRHWEGGACLFRAASRYAEEIL